MLIQYYFIRTDNEGKMWKHTFPKLCMAKRGELAWIKIHAENPPSSKERLGPIQSEKIDERQPPQLKRFHKHEST